MTTGDPQVMDLQPSPGVWSVTLEQSGSPGRHYHSVDVVVRVSHCVTVEQAVRSAQRACPGFAAVACERVS